MDNVKDLAYTTLASAVLVGDTTITVGDATVFPAPPFEVTVFNKLKNAGEAYLDGEAEIVLVTSITGNVLTVTRAQGGTSAIAIPTVTNFVVIQGIGTRILGQLEPADATILKQANVVDTLVSTSIIAPLSANQGKQLQDTKIPTADIINDLTTGGATKVLSAEQGVEAKTLIDGKAPIQDTDTWVLNTSFTGSADPIATNLGRFTHVDYIGTGMTQASGVFTFPRTGIWRVEFKGSFNPNADLFFGSKINVITDASGTPVITVRDDSFGQTNNTTGSTYCALNGLEVTATADVKVSFAVQVESVGVTVNGGSTVFRTGMIFTRIGDL